MSDTKILNSRAKDFVPGNVSPPLPPPAAVEEKTEKPGM